MDSSPFIYHWFLIKELVFNDQWNYNFHFTRSISRVLSLTIFKDSVHLLWIVFSKCSLKYKIKITWDFPGGAVAKSPHFQCRGPGSPIPGQGISPNVKNQDLTQPNKYFRKKKKKALRKLICSLNITPVLLLDCIRQLAVAKKVT